MRKKTKAKVLARPLNIKPLPLRPALPVSYETIMEAVDQSIGAGRLMLAEFQLAQIIQQLPKELYPKIRLLACYVQIGRAEPAETLIEEILKKFPRSVKALGTVAWYYRNRGEGEKALTILKKAIALSPGSFPTYYNLGLTYSALGRSDDAVASFNKAIALDPASGTCCFERALVLKGNTSPKYVASMGEQLKRKDLDKEERGLLHLSIAWAYDKKDIDQQFEHLNIGKALISEVHPWSELMMEELFTNVTNFFDKPFLESLKESAHIDDSPIFIAAMPRSGTTLLEQILSAHSHVFPIGESEVIGFTLEEVKLERGYTTEPFWKWINKQQFDKYSADLRQCFQKNARVRSADGKRIVDKSLDNFRQVGMILSLFPNARIIHLQRNPLDVLLSMYQLFIRLGGNTPWRLADLAKHYQNYEGYMEYWKSIFPDRILTVSYEDLVEDQEHFTKEILAFCDLPWEDACLEFYKQKRTVNTPSVMQVNQPINTQAVERWKPYAKHLKPAADILGIPLNL